jgi:DNA-binding IclR family transcriptional regulator
MPRDKTERYIIAAAVKVFQVEDWLALEADPMGWQTIRKVAEGTGLSQNEAFRSLLTLESLNRAEMSEMGWRINPQGIIRYSFRIQEVLASHAQRLGIKKGVF